MRALLLLLPVLAFAQEDRDKTRELIEAAYRMEAVQEYCMMKPDGVKTVEVEGVPVPVDCTLWYRWYEAEQRKKVG